MMNPETRIGPQICMDAPHKRLTGNTCTIGVMSAARGKLLQVSMTASFGPDSQPGKHWEIV